MNVTEKEFFLLSKSEELNKLSISITKANEMEHCIEEIENNGRAQVQLNKKPGSREISLPFIVDLILIEWRLFFFLIRSKIIEMEWNSLAKLESACDFFSINYQFRWHLWMFRFVYLMRWFNFRFRCQEKKQWMKFHSTVFVDSSSRTHTNTHKTTVSSTLN